MEIRTSKNGKEFQQFKFRDKSGEITGFLWNINDFTKTNFVNGVVVSIKGRKELYQNRAQFNQITLRLCVEGEPNDPSDYEEAPQMTALELEEVINTFIEKIDQPNWKTIVATLVDRNHDAFYSFPAAKTNHHDFPTGLAFHTVTMLQIAEHLSSIYTKLNTSLLYAGVILHDLGKVFELSSPTQPDYTMRGNLIGHISLMDEEIVKLASELSLDDSSTELVVLRHLILSHHGKLEYASPVEPRILEAEVLHLIDHMDASITMILSALHSTPYGTTSGRIHALGGRNFFNPAYEN